MAVKLSATAGGRLFELTIERMRGMFRVVIDGTEHEVDARKLEGDFYSILMEGRSFEVSVESQGSQYIVGHGAAQREVRLADATRSAREALRASGSGPEVIASIMPGKVVRVLVAAGESIEAGQGLIVIEAMKMENEIVAPRAGRIIAVNVEPGRAVETGAQLVVIE